MRISATKWRFANVVIHLAEVVIAGKYPFPRRLSATRVVHRSPESGPRRCTQVLSSSPAKPNPRHPSPYPHNTRSTNRITGDTAVPGKISPPLFPRRMLDRPRAPKLSALRRRARSRSPRRTEAPCSSDPFDDTLRTVDSSSPTRTFDSSPSTLRRQASRIRPSCLPQTSLFSPPHALTLQSTPSLSSSQSFSSFRSLSSNSSQCSSRIVINNVVETYQRFLSKKARAPGSGPLPQHRRVQSIPIAFPQGSGYLSN